MRNGRCTKQYPKKFGKRAIINEVGFLKYRRRDDGRTIQKKDCALNNRYIAPYNAELLSKYGYDINVECNILRNTILCLSHNIIFRGCY